MAITASMAGAAGNLLVGTQLKIISAIPAGVDSTVTVSAPGTVGGMDAETDAAYLARVLLFLRTGARYGKPGDFAAWAIDSSVQVTKAWEFRGYSVFGSLLIVVVGGSQVGTITPIADRTEIINYLKSVAPPVPFTVLTPTLLTLNPHIHLIPGEDSTANRAVVESTVRAWLDVVAKPGSNIAASQIRSAFVDGTTFTDGTVTLTPDPAVPTILQLPVLGVISWV